MNVLLSLLKYLNKGCALIPQKLWLVQWPLNAFLCNIIYCIGVVSIGSPLGCLDALFFIKIFGKTCALIPEKLRLVQELSHTFLSNITYLYCSIVLNINKGTSSDARIHLFSHLSKYLINCVHWSLKNSSWSTALYIAPDQPLCLVSANLSITQDSRCRLVLAGLSIM